MSAIQDVIKLLLKQAPLPEKHCDHPLTGDWVNFRDCHVKPDLVLIYRTEGDSLILARIGSHSELFG